MLRPGIQLANRAAPKRPTLPVRPPPAPPPMRPGELARAKARLLHAAQGHRELAAAHKAEAAKLSAALTAPSTPDAKRRRGEDGAELAPAVVAISEPPIEGGEHSHSTMAGVHDTAAADLEAKANALR